MTLIIESVFPDDPNRRRYVEFEIPEQDWNDLPREELVNRYIRPALGKFMDLDKTRKS